MSSKRIFAAATASLALSGCYTMSSPYRNIGDEDPYMGEAVRYNAAVQTINPDPVYAENGAQPGDNGQKGADAVKRYRMDEVNARHKAEAKQNSSGLSTTSGSGGGGGPK